MLGIHKLRVNNLANPNCCLMLQNWLFSTIFRTFGAPCSHAVHSKSLSDIVAAVDSTTIEKQPKAESTAIRQLDAMSRS